MVGGAVSSARDPRHDLRWKWLLFGLCALAGILIVVYLGSNFGIGGRPWRGFWGGDFSVSDRPFGTIVENVVPGGAMASAGLRDGDYIDLREQNFDGRVRLMFEPTAMRPVTLHVHRAARAFDASVTGRTVWEEASLAKVSRILLPTLASVCFLACAMLIAMRRWWVSEARVLALVILCAIGGTMLTPNESTLREAALELLRYTGVSALGFAQVILLVGLASQYGKRLAWRRPLEWSTYAINALYFLMVLVAVVGVAWLRIDPLPYFSLLGDLAGVNVNPALWFLSTYAPNFTLLLCMVAAILTSPVTQRPRAGWLLLPLPLAYFVANGVEGYFTFAPTNEVLVIGYLCALVGVVFVTYALLNRRVLDFAFVLNRAIVVSIIGLIVVIAFVLLEWTLGSVLAGVSHSTGLIANAALALVIGVSLNYLHKRVDQSVDLVLFRKRHENERALLAFSKEAAYVTDSDALLDATVERIRRHTDARCAALLIGADGFYTTLRSFGDGIAPSINENDEVILSLKTWHNPIDPHHYDTAVHAALALPMLSRGKLYGVLLLGERAGGEAYAPDEVDALSQLANGVGSALEALSLTTDGSATALADYVTGLHHAIASMNESITAEIRALRTSSVT